jgi:putative transposase
MRVLRNYKYRAYPTPEQIETIEEWRRRLRSNWNYANSQRRLRYKKVAMWNEKGKLVMRGFRCLPPGMKSYGYLEQQAELTEVRRRLPEFAAVPCTTAQRALRALDTAWQASWKLEDRGTPQFKGEDDNVLVCATAMKNPVGPDWVKFSKLGKIPAVIHRPLPGTAKSVTLIEDQGEWYAVVSTEYEVEDPEVLTRRTVGIDRGVIYAIADSNGECHQLPERVREIARQADELQSRNDDARKKERGKQSNNWKKGARRVAKKRRRARRIREDWLHKLALEYAEKYDVVVLEDLVVKNMTKSAKGTKDEPGKNVAAKSGLNRSILEQGWGSFIQKLCYKMIERGGDVFVVPPQNTSRTCSECGAVDAKSRDKRVFCCTSCGFTDDADVNAARVILQRHEAGNSKLLDGYSALIGKQERKKERKKTHAIRRERKAA